MTNLLANNSISAFGNPLDNDLASIYSTWLALGRENVSRGVANGLTLSCLFFRRAFKVFDENPQWMFDECGPAFDAYDVPVQMPGWMDELTEMIRHRRGVLEGKEDASGGGAKPTTLREILCDQNRQLRDTLPTPAKLLRAFNMGITSLLPNPMFQV